MLEICDLRTVVFAIGIYEGQRCLDKSVDLSIVV